ncbi:MAG: hypothetical protein K2N05_10685 [Muribaculaceae bacterium]|nr:hypothetical protein [Muribaculaceae bacterium]
MKKILLLVMMLMVGASTVTVNAQTKEYQKQQSQYQKQAEKTAKKMAKELKKAKWESTGSVPLEMELEKFYLETKDFGGKKSSIEHELQAKTVSAGEKALLLNAQAIYAQEIQTMLAADLANSTSADNEAAFEEYVARVAAKVKHEFNGDIRRAILLKKPTNDGRGYLVRAYYLVDEDAGRLRAKRIAEQIDRNNDTIDSIHNSVFGDEK